MWFINLMLFNSFLPYERKIKCIFLTTLLICLFQKTFLKNPPKKQTLLTSWNKWGYCQGEKWAYAHPGGGRDSGTSLDSKDTYNIRRSRTSKMFGCCLQRRVVGVWGQSPRKYGCRAESPAGCGQSPRFGLVNKRKLPPCGRHLPLCLLYGNIPVKVGSYFLDKSRKSPPYPWQYSTFFEIGRQGKPGILTCPNGQLQIPKPSRKKRKEEKNNKNPVFMQVSGISWCNNRTYVM